MTIVDVAQKVLDTSTAQKIDGTLIDLQTANAVVTVFTRLNDKNKERFLALGTVGAANAAWAVIAKATGKD